MYNHTRFPILFIFEQYSAVAHSFCAIEDCYLDFAGNPIFSPADHTQPIDFIYFDELVEKFPERFIHDLPTTD